MIDERLKKIHKGVDLCFLFDFTGSMGPWMEQAKAKLKVIMEKVQVIDATAIVRCALVGYRDIGDKDRHVVVDFCPVQDETLQKTLDTQKPDGGGDAPEDIVGAFVHVEKLNWVASTRLIVHFVDAPCHGKGYHDSVDSYPEGDPSGQTPEEFLERFSQKKNRLLFCQNSSYHG